MNVEKSFMGTIIILPLLSITIVVNSGIRVNIHNSFFNIHNSFFNIRNLFFNICNWFFKIQNSFFNNHNSFFNNHKYLVKSWIFKKELQILKNELQILKKLFVRPKILISNTNPYHWAHIQTNMITPKIRPLFLIQLLDI